MGRNHAAAWLRPDEVTSLPSNAFDHVVENLEQACRSRNGSFADLSSDKLGAVKMEINGISYLIGVGLYECPSMLPLGQFNRYGELINLAEESDLPKFTSFLDKRLHQRRTENVYEDMRPRVYVEHLVDLISHLSAEAKIRQNRNRLPRSLAIGGSSTS